jgi:hypothetical protein
VVTWTIPVPQGAKLTIINDRHRNEKIFETAAAVTDKEIPAEVPKKYTEKLHAAVLHEPTRLADARALVAWEKKHGIEMEKKPLDVFESYFSSNHEVEGLLITHPSVANPAAWKS